MSKLFIVTTKPKIRDRDKYHSYYVHIRAKSKAEAIRLAAEKSPSFPTSGDDYTKPVAREVEEGTPFAL